MGGTKRRVMPLVLVLIHDVFLRGHGSTARVKLRHRNEPTERVATRIAQAPCSASCPDGCAAARLGGWPARGRALADAFPFAATRTCTTRRSPSSAPARLPEMHVRA